MEKVIENNEIVIQKENLDIMKVDNKEIVYANFTNLSLVRDKVKILGILDEAERLISRYEPKSVLIITNLENLKFDREVSNRFQEYTKNNKPFVKASAIVGLAGMQKVIFSLIKKTTGRSFYLANDVQEAVNWLIEQ